MNSDPMWRKCRWLLGGAFNTVDQMCFVVFLGLGLQRMLGSCLLCLVVTVRGTSQTAHTMICIASVPSVRVQRSPHSLPGRNKMGSTLCGHVVIPDVLLTLLPLCTALHFVMSGGRLQPVLSCLQLYLEVAMANVELSTGNKSRRIANGENRTRQM